MEFQHRHEKREQKNPIPVSPATDFSACGRGVEAASQHDSFIPPATNDPAVLQCRMELMSHWADEPAAAHPATRPRAQRSGFDKLTTGEQGHSIAMKHAPAQLVLPQEMVQGMRVAWNQSLPRGTSQEQGGLLTRNRDGSLKWLPSAPGDSRKITLSYEDVNPHQTLLANGHTHPYDKDEQSLTHVPFSGGDLAAQVFDDERLSIVQSGEGMFASARTREFDEMIRSRGPGGRWGLSKEIEKFWKRDYDSAEGNLREKAEAATRATTDWYHLLYYAGKQGTLQRVNTSQLESGGK